MLEISKKDGGGVYVENRTDQTLTKHFKIPDGQHGDTLAQFGWNRFFDFGGENQGTDAYRIFAKMTPAELALQVPPQYEPVHLLKGNPTPPRLAARGANFGKGRVNNPPPT